MQSLPRLLLLTALCVRGATALDNGLALTPPLGWRSYNAFGGRPTQQEMSSMMDVMVSRERTVAGKPTSLLDLGYNHVGLDGGWNYCFPENNTFHWASNGRPVWNADFPDPKAMVDKAHRLGLKAGWYLNNCGCAENHFQDDATIETMMRGSVQMLAEQGWDGVKFDSCSQFHNLTRWVELMNATGHPVLVENCHQGGYTPGMRQWQGYLKNVSGAEADRSGRAGPASAYTHYLGMFYGMNAASTLDNATFASCRDHCDQQGVDPTNGCGGFTFAGNDPSPAPTAPIGTCYTMPRPHPNHMDMSNAAGCTGDTSPSNCPFHFYRVSGDIFAAWRSVLANLEYTLPFLGEGGVHLPFPQDSTVRSRPGGWAYPDMLEVGNLANATEDRSHFGAWAVMSSPLILSFNLSDPARMARAWPIITNRAVLAVNQRWVGSPGRRVSFDAANGAQVWAKPMGSNSYAVFLLNGGDEDATDVSVQLRNVSGSFAPPHSAVCIRNLYTGAMVGGGHPQLPRLSAALGAHDSVMYCVWPAAAGGNSTACDVENACPHI